MKPYTFALTIFRLIAVCMALYIGYGWIVRSFSMHPPAHDADFDALIAYNLAAYGRSSLLTLACAVGLYLLAPRLAHLVALSKES